jgi:WD40 repeat protein
MRRANKLQAHFAHVPGFCGVAVSPDGRFALSSGKDSAILAHDIRECSPEPWWVTSRNGEPEAPELPAASLHEKPINDIAINPDAKTFATACDDGFVRIFSASVTAANASDPLAADSELIQACARFGGPVRSLSFSPTGAFLAAAGDEPGVIKVIMTAQPSNVSILRATSKELGLQPVVALAFDPKSDFIASVAGDGSAAVWNVDSGKCVSAVSINDRRASCVAWAPDGSQVLFGTDKGAVLVSRDTWTFERLLQDESGGDDEDDDEDGDEGGFCRKVVPVSSVSAIAWSKNGRYVLTGREDCSIRLWHVESSKVLSNWCLDHVAQAIRWHPTLNVFMVMDRLGQWVVTGDIVPGHMASPVEIHSTELVVQMPTIPEAPPSKRPGVDSGSGSSSDSGSDSEDQVRRSSAKKWKGLELVQKSTKKQSKSANSVTHDAEKDEEFGSVACHDEADEDDEEEVGTIAGSEVDNDVEARRPEFNFDASDLDVDEEDDVVEIRRRRELARARAQVMDTDEEEEEFERRRRRRERRKKRRDGEDRHGQVAAIPAAQSSFMPSSTPLQDKLVTKKRILSWTLTAAIVSYDENSHDIVEIEFADTTKRNIGIKDHFGFTLGCISETGVMLASPAGKDQNSLIMFRPFSSWSNQSEWSQFLAQDESALAIALGVRFAAVALSQPRNIVRLFSLSGIQTDVFGVPGRVVTMAAAKDRLAIVYAASSFTPELRYLLVEVASCGEVLKTLASDSLVMSPDSSLEWLGFTRDSCDLVAYDSSGCIWMLAVDRGGMRWLPMLNDAAKSAECNWFWLAAVTSEQAIGAPCLSNERHPPATPRPALRTIPLLAPVITQVSKAGQVTLEERLFRTRMKLARCIAAKAAAGELYESDDDEMEDAAEAASAMELETDKCILALLEVACRQEQNLRAFDLATRLNCVVSFKFAMSLANHYKRSAVAGRIEELANRKTAAAAAEEEEKRAALVSAAHQRTSPTTPIPPTRQLKQTSVDSGSDEGQGSDTDDASDDGVNDAAGSGRDEGVNYDDSADEEQDESTHAKNKDTKKLFQFPPPPFARPSLKTGKADLTGVSDDEEDELTTRRVRDPPVRKNSGRITPSQIPAVPAPAACKPAVLGLKAAPAATTAVKKRPGAHIGNRFQKRVKKE